MRFYLGGRELSCPKLIHEIQEVGGNVIFGDTVSGNPKQMRFAELDFPIGRSDSQQVPSVSSTPCPSICSTRFSSFSGLREQLNIT